MLRPRTGWRRLPPQLVAGFVLLIMMVSGSLYLAVALSENAQRTLAVSDYRRAVTDVLSAARDAEIGQRGYLLTNKEAYLEPYRRARASVSPALARIADSDVEHGLHTADVLRPVVFAKFAEMNKTIALQQSGQHDAALQLVETDTGKTLMDRLRAIAEGERRWGLAESARASNSSIRLVKILTIGLIAGLAAVVTLSLVWLEQARRQFAEVDRERAYAEAALTQLRQESNAREASDAKVRQLQKMETIGQLTGGIAHDFNNMLAVVMGSLELADRRLLSEPDRVKTHLAHAREGATRAAALTARLLAFSRQQPLAPSPLEPNKLLDGLCEMLGRTLGESISLECIGGAGVWRCYADAGELENAVVNLAVNARDAMPDGGKLTIETANASIDDDYARSRGEVEAGQYVVICVTDTGCGMTAEVIERAFDPFFTTKAVGKGTGLGLSQVFGFAKQSGGHVAIYSEIDEGTTVKLYLPRYFGTAASSAAKTPVLDTPEGKAEEVILVVEDEHRVRQFASDALQELGYTVLTAESPSAALNILEERPDVVVLFTDIVMPEMNGRRLADLAQQLRPDLQVLFTTGYTRNAVVHNGMIDAGVAFLSKPYSISDLANKLRDVIAGRGSNRSV